MSQTNSEESSWLKSLVWKGIPTIVLLVAVVWLVLWWRTPPVVEYDNLKYIQLLSTALSARNEEWLAKVELAVRQRQNEGHMSDKEFAHFQKLIAQARSGAWEQADRACFDFAAAQLSRRRPPVAPE